MAMNKTEKAKMQELEEQIQIALALRWTEKVLPDVEKPESFSNKIARGFLFNAYTGQVDEMWSESIRHGYATSPQRGSQGGISMYSTRLLALKALRHAVEVRSAEALRGIDKRIAAELAADNK
jgi:hypothetical protein